MAARRLGHRCGEADRYAHRRRCAACSAAYTSDAAPPPPNRAFDGLPITGNRGFAERLGFTRCVDTSSALRCRREGVMLFGTGPYSAAVDLDR